MRLIEYLRTASPAERARVADEAATTVNYLYVIACGHRRCGAVLARKVELATKCSVSSHELRPDLFDPPSRARRAKAIR